MTSFDKPQIANNVSASSGPEEGVSREKQDHSRGDPGEVGGLKVTDTTQEHDPRVLETDLANVIPGFFRVLDLIQDQSSGGLVDKIIIEQEALGRLINNLQSNAYTSITKVDFAALDKVQIRPIGLYGSKSAIVDFLRRKGVVDNTISTAMLQPTDVSLTTTRPSLRSGMYIVRHGSDHQIYAIYWPEDGTWDDDCSQSVHRNRVTFMRYLTKISDQVVCLMSDEHASSIIWKGNDADESDVGFDDEDTDRMFDFEVTKTNEQEENVKSRAGFEISIPPLVATAAPRHVDILPPVLTRGERHQGLITAMYTPAKRMQRRETMNREGPYLEELLQRPSIRLHDSVSSEALEILLNLGLRHAAPDAADYYKKTIADVLKAGRESLTHELDVTIARIGEESAGLDIAIARHLMGVVAQKIPLIDQVAPSPSADEHTDNRVLTICALYPGCQRELQVAESKLKLPTVHTQEYRHAKTRFLTLEFLLRSNPNLSSEQRQTLVQSPLDVADMPPVTPARTSKSWFTAPLRLVGLLSSSSAPSSALSVTDVPADRLRVDDATFLSALALNIDQEPLLKEIGHEALQLARPFIWDAMVKEGKHLSKRFQSIQRDACQNSVREANAAAQKDRLELLRKDLLMALRAGMDSGSSR